MDFHARLDSDEANLRAIVTRLGTKGATAVERAEASCALRAKLATMRAYVEDLMSGRSEYERGVLEYRLRVECPLYFHLSSLSRMPPAFVDWECEPISNAF